MVASAAACSIPHEFNLRYKVARLLEVTAPNTIVYVGPIYLQQPMRCFSAVVKFPVDFVFTVELVVRFVLR